MIIDGLALPNVVLRKKGFIDSQSTFQLSIKIKLNHSDEKAGIEGLITLTLSNKNRRILK